MSFYQIILAIIAIIFLLTGLVKFAGQQRSQTFFKFIVTLIVWGGILMFSVSPRTSYTVSELLGLGQNLNTLIFIGFVVIFIIIFRLLNVIERLERNISEIVRKEALEKLNTKQ